jgi:hypothetical protein
MASALGTLGSTAAAMKAMSSRSLGMKVRYLAGFAGFPLSVRPRRHWNGAGFGLARTEGPIIQRLTAELRNGAGFGPTRTRTEGPIIQRLTAELRNGADSRMALNIMVRGFARVAGFSLSVHCQIRWNGAGLDWSGFTVRFIARFAGFQPSMHPHRRCLIISHSNSQVCAFSTRVGCVAVPIGGRQTFHVIEVTRSLRSGRDMQMIQEMRLFIMRD